MGGNGGGGVTVPWPLPLNVNRSEPVLPAACRKLRGPEKVKNHHSVTMDARRGR